jgi:hypothetical protein
LLKRSCAVLAALTVLCCSVARADYEQPPDRPNEHSPKREWPPGPTRDYLRDLQRPDNWKSPSRWRNPTSLLCCDAGDTVDTKFKVEPGNGPHPEDQWYAWINDKWVFVPPDKIVPEHAPDGRAYPFVIGGLIQCFVRPRGGL